MWFILIALAPLAIGAAAGWFLALWPVIALTAIGLCALLWLRAEGQGVPAGTSGGFGIAAMAGMVILFLVAMWLAYAISAHWSFHAPDLSGIRDFLFK